MPALNDKHLVTGVDHVAFPTFDPAATVVELARVLREVTIDPV